MDKKRKPSAKSIISKYVHQRYYRWAKGEWGRVRKFDRKDANEIIDECYENWKQERPDKNYRFKPMTAHEFVKEWYDTMEDAEDEQRNIHKYWK